ncbi:MAG: PAS domain-containing sensor histidine kinase [Acidimicrobiales bacterium]
MHTFVVEALPDAAFWLDAGRRVGDMNKAASEITGYVLDELRGCHLGEALVMRDGDGRDLACRDWPPSAGLRSVARVPEREVSFRRRDGTEARGLLTARYSRDGAGAVTGAAVCLRPAMRRSGGDAMEIISTVSHELRSPLTSVKGYTSLLLGRWDRLSEEQKKMMLEQVNRDADRVTRLVTELLDISRLESGRLVLRRRMIDLGELATNVANRVRLEYPDLRASLDFPADFAKVYADADKMTQVLTNLVENACKYASPVGLAVTGSSDDSWATVDVADRGEGIPPADLDRVFTKFFRGSDGKPSGSGLGLWIARGLVEAHGGSLVARSEIGLGSTFSFRLPLATFEQVVP